MDRKQAEDVVTEALRALAAQQPELFRLDVAERSLTHHLAHEIASRIGPERKVDAEYNRHGGDPKGLDLPRRGATDRELRATTAFPDIIIHKRESDDQNILVIEVKKCGEPLDYDARKLRAFKDELHYAHAAHVIVWLDEQGAAKFEIKFVDD